MSHITAGVFSALDRMLLELPEFVPAEPFHFADFEAYLRRLQAGLQTFWLDMAPVYAAILGAEGNVQDDGLSLSASIADWPDSFAAQQAALLRLLDTSPLRWAWRQLADWMCNNPDWPADKERTAALQAAFADSAKPLREIPLYQGYLRNSCQQIVCLPESQWQALFDPARDYRPQAVDEAIVQALALRIARVLNEPCRATDAATPPWCEVWGTNPRSLVVARDMHGMTDRCFDEYLRLIDHPPGQTPSWRFLGHYGHLRVDGAEGIGGEPWHVVILAPQHFLVALIRQLQAPGQS